MNLNRGLHRAFVVGTCVWYLAGGVWAFDSTTKQIAITNRYLAECVANGEGQVYCENLWSQPYWITYVFVAILPLVVYAAIRATVAVITWTVRGFRSETAN